MTSKSTARKKPTRKATGASPAELKRQLAAEKVKGDNQSNMMAEMMAGMKALTDKVEELAQAPTAAQTLASHDQSERVINSVLNEPMGDSHLPPKPDSPLPDSLVQAQAAFDRRDMARNNPVILRDTVDTDNEAIGQFEDRVMDSTGQARESLAPIVPVDEGIVLENNKRYSKEKLKIELFMQELVLVKVHDTTDETQIPMPEVTNSGRNQFFVRNQAQWVKRMYIEPLARAKRTTYTQRKVRHELDGSETYVQIPHTTLMYPFEVLDDSQEGRNWLRSILSESY
jgi:hypothetical protein